MYVDARSGPAARDDTTLEGGASGELPPRLSVRGAGADYRQRPRRAGLTVVSVFDDLVGQDDVVAELRHAAAAATALRAAASPQLTEGTAGMTHASLLTAPPGSGRSAAARAGTAALPMPARDCA